MSTLTILTEPPAAVTAASRAGPSVLHGPHQGAQKSTMTGMFCDISTTSFTNVCSDASLIKSSAGVAVVFNSSITWVPFL